MSRGDVERIDDQVMATKVGRNAQAFADILADEFVMTDDGSPEPITDKAGVLAYMQPWFNAFPDMSTKQTNRVVSADSVAAEIEFTGTNTGPMVMGGKEIPPTGKMVVGTGTYFARVKDGKVVEYNGHPNIAGIMMQLGMMPGM